MEVEKRLVSLGLTLPDAPRPLANYQPAVLDGNLLYTCGASCIVNGKPKFTGRVGADLTLEQGYEAARITALNLLSIVKAAVGDLDRIERMVKILGFVNSASDFHRQPEVINGASDLLVELLGDKGRHARSALGTNNLPMNIPVEIELIVRVNLNRI